MFSYQKTLIVFLVLSMAAALSGCGEKTVTASSSTRAEASESCLGCHESARSKVTTKLIGEEWQLSSHNLKNGAGCADCHEPDPGHPASCNLCHGGRPSGSSMGSAVHNPDESGKCAKCHTARAGFGLSTHNGKTRNTLTSHFSNTSSSYVSSRNVGKCRTCHNPHDTSSNMPTLRAWARSGHGATAAPPWNYYDFKNVLYGNPAYDCNRCHTTTGFIKYITTGDATPWGSTSDKTKEMLGCNACHIDYSFALRPANPAHGKYTGGEVTYPDVGTSNLCLNCHVGRESGNTIKNIQRNYTSAGFVNSHYLTAGGIIFGEIGYEYAGRDYADPAGYKHRYIGTSDSRGNSVVAGNSGPCVGCHLANKTQPGEKHTFKPYIIVAGASKEAATPLSPTCVGCHTSNPDRTFLEVTWKPRYQATLLSLKYFLETNQYRKLYFNASNPYFFLDSNGDGVLSASEAVGSNVQKKWHSVGGPEVDLVVTGKNNMGAAFNYNLLIHDRGGVAHNRYYTRRLIYDAIDWLDDNIMNYSVGTTLNLLPGTGNTGFKDEAMAYLIKTTKDPVTGNTTYNIGLNESERY